MSPSFFEALITGSNKSSPSIPNDFEYYWGEPTAPIDWCETNYTANTYIAELHNTWTNIAYIFTGFIVVFKSYKISLPIQFYICGLSMILTGIFSGIFHATLWYWMQRLDEIFENLILITMIHSDVEGAFHKIVIHFILCSIGICFVNQFLFCEIHLVVCILLCLIKFHKISHQYKTIAKNVRKAALWTIVGFGCWLIDRLGCDFIIKYFIFNPQLHAWWHIFTSFALWEGFIAISQVYVIHKTDNIKTH